MNDDIETEWYTVEEAAKALQRSTKQVTRYADDGRIKRQRFGNRVLYYVPDVLAVRKELDIAENAPPPPPKPKVEVVQRQQESALIALLREREAYLREQEHEIRELLYKLGRAESEINRRVLPEAVDELKQKLAQAESERDQLKAERDQLKAEITQFQQLWWKRFTDK